MIKPGRNGAGGAPPIVPRVIGSAKRADEKVVSFVRERPIAALCATALVGYVIGRFVSRLG